MPDRHPNCLLRALGAGIQGNPGVIPHILLARVADIVGIGHVIVAVVAAADLVQVVGQVVNGDIRGIRHGIGNEPGGRPGEIGIVGNGDALPVQLQTVQVDGEVAHFLLGKGGDEENPNDRQQGNEPQGHFVQPQNGIGKELAPPVGHIQGDHGFRVHVPAGFLQQLLKLLNAKHFFLFLPLMLGKRKLFFQICHSLYRFLILATYSCICSRSSPSANRN